MNNREIKFRVWDKEYGDWVKDDCVGIDANGTVLTYRQGGIIGGWIQENNSEAFIIQQFTGMKDKNEKEIYEGDLLEISPEDQDKYYKPHCHVWYSEWSGSWVVSFNHQYSETSCDLYMVNRKYSVVGNLMENPNLLK